MAICPIRCSDHDKVTWCGDIFSVLHGTAAQTDRTSSAQSVKMQFIHIATHDKSTEQRYSYITRLLPYWVRL